MADITYSFDEKGLVAAVVQDFLSGRVLMVAYMNAEALERTRQTGEAHFYSRSRKQLWKKGGGSGNVMRVRKMVVDCDADTVLLQVDPAGPACHTGASACFFRDEHGQPFRAGTEIERLEERILERQTSTADCSYTRALLDGGAPRVGLKIREEADELARAIASESEERVAREAADLIYHALVGLALRGVTFRDVLTEITRRAGVSGLAEKAGRPGS